MADWNLSLQIAVVSPQKPICIKPLETEPECLHLEEGDINFFRIDFEVDSCNIDEVIQIYLNYKNQKVFSADIVPTLIERTAINIEHSEDGCSIYYIFNRYVIQHYSNELRFSLHLTLEDNEYDDERIKAGIPNWEVAENEGMLIDFALGKGRFISLPFTDAFYTYERRNSKHYAQRKPLWYKFRAKRIGGSSLATWLGLFRSFAPDNPSAKSKLEAAFLNLCGKGKSLASNRAMRLGRVGEIDDIVSCLAAFPNWTLKEAGWINHPTISWAGGSPDGLITDSEMRLESVPAWLRADIRDYEASSGNKVNIQKGVFEAKVSEKDDKMPYYYIPQLQFVMETTNRWWSVLVRHKLGTPIVKVYYVYRSRALWKRMQKVVETMFSLIEMEGNCVPWDPQNIPFPDDAKAIERDMQNVANMLNSSMALQSGRKVEIPFLSLHSAVELRRSKLSDGELACIDVEPMCIQKKALLYEPKTTTTTTKKRKRRRMSKKVADGTSSFKNKIVKENGWICSQKKCKTQDLSEIEPVILPNSTIKNRWDRVEEDGKELVKIVSSLLTTNTAPLDSIADVRRQIQTYTQNLRFFSEDLELEIDRYMSS